MAAPNSPQPALATTKRKFNLLLDNLTAGASTTSLASSLHHSNASAASFSRPATPEHPSKRARSSDASMERPRVVSGNDRIQALKDQLFTPRKEGNGFGGAGLRAVGPDRTPVKQSTTSGTPRRAPNFQPFSQEQFLGRLKTFADVKKWTNKPDAIAEVVWAKRGWSCDTWNTVACKGGCEQRVSVKLKHKRKDANGKEIEMSEDLMDETDKGLVQKYQELVIDGHHEDCLWRKRGCQDDIYHIPIPSRAKSMAELLSRYHSFQEIAKDLPLLENVMYPDPSIEDMLKRIPPTLFHLPGSTTAEDLPTSPTDITAFTLALFGWRGSSESRISLATCDHCFQRLGLWLYTDQRLKEMSEKLEVPVESLRLNLVESHREHCPWKNPDTQDNPKDGAISNMAGWQTLEFMLMGKRRERLHKTVQSVDLGSEIGTTTGSFESERTHIDGDDDKADSLNEKWKRFKAKLRRTTSKRSLKSMKSHRSFKSVKSVGDKDKENERTPAAQ
ncbi:C3HC zinc finger-like-domain-containing protein [Massariosphaeria phaeospora]|uniref:C3HC zinc finger-like-domain-containing protein n=1 Tax=Massariosphaeria phaeospora TaxID=100035 RepID=A0A7C8MIZ0_9PLEO|nr:C3HC zinc finger-like-domain-containing protein [Massariosphaeria phaeospora]